MQSVPLVQIASAAQVLFEPQSGPSALTDAAHSSSDWQPRHTFAVSQTGVAGRQPPAGVQSTHLCVVVLHLSLVPLQPLSSTQSTQVAVAESHWLEPPHPVPVPDGSQSAHLPLSAPLREHAGVPLDFWRHRASAFVALSHPTHTPPSQSGAALPQSPSSRHSTQVPGDPLQNFSVPVPEHWAPLPQTHPRLEHPFASVVLHAVPQAVHCDGLVPTHAGTPLFSQQRLLLEQPAMSEGLHAPHVPCWGPLVTHAPAPPGFIEHRSFAVDAMDDVSQGTQTFPTQRGFFGSPVQSASAAHSTQ